MGLMALAISLTVPSSFPPGQVKSESQPAQGAWQVSAEETQELLSPLHLLALQEDAARQNLSCKEHQEGCWGYGRSNRDITSCHTCRIKIAEDGLSPPTSVTASMEAPVFSSSSITRMWFFLQAIWRGVKPFCRQTDGQSFL